MIRLFACSKFKPKNKKIPFFTLFFFFDEIFVNYPHSFYFWSKIKKNVFFKDFKGILKNVAQIQKNIFFPKNSKKCLFFKKIWAKNVFLKLFSFFKIKQFFVCFFWISSQLSVHWSLLIHSTHFLGILQPLVSTESSEIKKKGQIEKLFNDFLPNRDYFQQNLKRLPI